jgi:hypothetical protein
MVLLLLDPVHISSQYATIALISLVSYRLFSVPHSGIRPGGDRGSASAPHASSEAWLVLPALPKVVKGRDLELKFLCNTEFDIYETRITYYEGWRSCRYDILMYIANE